MRQADHSVKSWQNLPISNLKPDLQTLMHKPSLVKIHWDFLKLSFENENVLQTDVQMDGHTDINMKP